MAAFKLRMFPAADGNCLMLTWGNGGSQRHALVDFGRAGGYRAAKKTLGRIGTFELCVITHIDADHIAGAVTYFGDNEKPFKARHIWFNGHRQLQAASARQPLVPLSVPQAEKVSAAIASNGWSWNTQFASTVVSTDSPEARKAMQIEGGLQLTLLSPDDDALVALLPSWQRHLEKAHLRIGDAEPGDDADLPGGLVTLGLDVDEIARARFEEDDAIANGSSIAFLAEFASKRILMTGDAHPGVIVKNLRTLGYSKTKRLELHCLKVSHHGSRSNTSPELLELIDCTCFAFSTDGSRHGHPDRETIAWILKNDPHRPKTLIYNYPQTEAKNEWLAPQSMKKWNYECAFPEADDAGIELDIG